MWNIDVGEKTGHTRNEPALSISATDVTTYRWSRAQVLRPVGLLAVLLGLLWLIVAVVGEWRGEGAGSVLTLAAAGLTALSLVTAIWFLVWPPRVLELSATGYRVVNLRGGGVPTAEWSDVASVHTQMVTAGPVMVVELSDGGTSLVPLSLLGLRATEAQREMHNRLNTAFGYRRLGEQS